LLRHRDHTSSEKGFTLVELLVVIIVVPIIFIGFTEFFDNYLLAYTDLQTNGTNFLELASQSQRIASVLRGLTDIVSESANDLQIYAYFSPSDTYVSLVHYYLNNTGTQLKADVTPMTANPPIGTPITAQLKTYTIISNFYKPPGSSLFVYQDATGATLTPPIADEHSILEITVNLAEPVARYSNGQTLSTTVSLRNRKTNL
jgi:prepilin-type N-terminal cleavage/methylation domain-containing protein